MNTDRTNQDHQLEGFCRGCLIKYDSPSDLLQYTEKNRRLFVYSTGLQVKRNDTFTFQLCKGCYMNMKLSCKFKKQCRTSDKQFKSFLSLREISDIDLCTFLKNSNDTLRFPLLSGNSTPANQRYKDDDNESTCTSIQNFMSDILQGTEMPDTEARIIKEVIEEEADLLEDSLDSHWLQDDVSIDTDFRLDFSFSPFSARSINNDHCYTPSREIESSRNSYNNHVRKVLEQLPTSRDDNYDDSPNDISINGINEALKDLCGKSQTGMQDYMQDNLIEEYVDANEEIPMFESYPDMPKLIDDTDNNFPAQSEIDIAIKNISIDLKSGVNKKNFYVSNDCDGQMDEETIEHQSYNSALEKQITDENTAECSIDKKIKQALDNNNKVIPLDDLLISPARDFPEGQENSMPKIDFSEAIGSSTPIFDTFPETIGVPAKINDNIPVADIIATPKYEDIPKICGIATPKVNIFPEGTGASTPMINNILFGEKLELDDNSNNACKVGLNIEKFEDIGGDIDILEDFFKEKEEELNQDETSEPVVKTEHITVVLEPGKNVDSVDDSKCYDLEGFVCKICNKENRTLRALKLHMIHNHAIKIPRMSISINNTKICPYCGKVIMDKGNFSKHVRRHNKEEHKCNVCSLCFSSASNLKQHMRVHKDKVRKKKKEHKYVCDVCGAGFQLHCNLNKHARRHKSPHLACSFNCGKSFHRNSERARHEMTHTGERSYMCPVPGCGKQFSMKYNVVVHIKRQHTGELRDCFICHYCSKKYRKKAYLVLHIQRSEKCMKRRQGIEPKKKKSIPVLEF